MGDAGACESRRDSGASTAEYGLIIFAISAVVAVIVFAFGEATAGLFADTKTCIEHHVSASCS
jgi:Flp pilus assembly pilin Flp